MSKCNLTRMPDGKWAIRQEMTISYEPMMLIYYWPVETVTPIFGSELWDGMALTPKGSGGDFSWYNAITPGNYTSVGVGLRTQCLKVEQVKIEPPKVRTGIQTRWKDGRWQKYLQAKGWVNA